MTSATGTTPTVLRTIAPAKVNLGLRVTARRPDGFHELRSVFLRLDLADELALTALEAHDTADRLVIEGDPDCPVEGNLVLTAVRAFRDAAAAPVGPAAVTLRKRIPMAAGLAGGSSDAAATLRLLARRHPGAVDDLRLDGVALAVGSDVPFFLSAVGGALVSGTGQEVEPLPPPIEPLGVLLVTPAVGLSTAAVFGAWDRLPEGARLPTVERDVLDLLAAELRAGASPSTIVGLAPALRDANDLWPAAVAVEPRMADCRTALEDRLARPVLMTGSGSTLVALLPDPPSAQDAAARLRSDLTAALAGARVAATATGTPYPPEVVIEQEGA